MSQRKRKQSVQKSLTFSLNAVALKNASFN